MKTNITIFTYAQKYTWESEFNIDHSVNFNPTTSSDRLVVPVCQQVVEIDVPDISKGKITEFEIKELEKMRDKINADTVVKVKAIDNKIQSLLAIELK